MYRSEFLLAHCFIYMLLQLFRFRRFFIQLFRDVRNDLNESIGRFIKGQQMKTSDCIKRKKWKYKKVARCSHYIHFLLPDVGNNFFID